jgi:putative membrane protein
MVVAKRIQILLIILSALTLFACTHGPNRPMGNWNHMVGYGFGGGFMWLFFLALVGIVIYFLIQSSKSKDSNDLLIETPLDILKKRYARGEIDKEEYDRMKNDLEAS